MHWEELATSPLWTCARDTISCLWPEKTKEKTAFSTPDGHYQFTVMPFGVCNGPSSFQRLMGIVLKGLQWHGCLVYLDDIIVYGRTFQEHLERLTAVFERLESAGLRLKPSKCTFVA